MASVRKREWPGSKGKPRTAWLVDYVDTHGKRRTKQFRLKKDADAFVAAATWEIRQGTHTADSQSITVKAAGQLWLARARREALEPTTISSYEQHVRLHIDPLLGSRKLSQLTRPIVEAYRDTLLDSGRSKAMVARVLRSLTSIVSEAERIGYIAKNPCRGVTLRRGSRERSKVQPPTKEELRLLIEAARHSRPIDLPMLLVFVFAGLRASELRALPWRNVDFQHQTITVDQRADSSNLIGKPKSAAGWRTIPVPPIVITELRKWRLACPPSQLDLVFASSVGTPIFHANLVLGFQEPLQRAVGLTAPAVRDGKPLLDANGNAVLEGRYTLHSLRHAAASLWIERRVAPKRVQSWMGHSSIQVTFDTYGHLFAAAEDDAAVVDAVEASIMRPQRVISANDDSIPFQGADDEPTPRLLSN